MTMERRVAKVEGSLSPTQLVLRWLAEAHVYGDIPAYVASLLTQDAPEAPLDRLAREAERGVRTSMRGKRPEVVNAAVRSALRETVFRFELVMRTNVTVHDLLDHEVLLEALFASQLALLLHDRRKERLADESHLHRFAQCRDLTALRVTELLATQEAISRAEVRFLDGHGTLFPDIAAAFEHQVSQSEQLSVMAADSAELDGVEAAGPDDADELESRIAQLVADLVEPSKSTALDKLGEGRPAFDIANAWLRAKFGIAAGASL